MATPSPMKALETDEFRFIDGHWEVNGGKPGTPNSKAPLVDHGDDIVRPERYYSREEMDLEWNGLWTKVWTTAGRVSDVSKVGDYFTYQLGRESFIIVRTSPTQIKAFYNVCHHRGNKLIYNNFGSVTEFVCAFHSWAYSLDGALKRITDEELFPKRVICDRPGMTEVRCDTWGGFVFINMDENAEDLQSYLGIWPEYCAPHPLDGFRVFSEASMEWNANWKTAMDAFIEAYHSHVVHPEVRDMYDDVRVQYDCFARATAGCLRRGASSAPGIRCRAS
jgi:phenylpropionate dioxygenase-like ring-hydroxylating dioxygenase large terminal subunit